MGRTGSGVEARDKSIRISFVLDGQTKKETIKTDGKPMPPTPKNLVYANKLAAEIKDKIRHGTFNYADYFPASLNASTGIGGPDRQGKQHPQGLPHRQGLVEEAHRREAAQGAQAQRHPDRSVHRAHLERKDPKQQDQRPAPGAGPGHQGRSHLHEPHRWPGIGGAPAQAA
jgi:hypothetical protein